MSAIRGEMIAFRKNPCGSAFSESVMEKEMEQAFRKKKEDTEFSCAKGTFCEADSSEFLRHRWTGDEAFQRDHP